MACFLGFFASQRLSTVKLRAFFCFIGNSDFEGTKNKRTFVEHTLDDRIMNIINRL